MGLSIYALKLGDKISTEKYEETGDGWHIYQAEGMQPINHIPTIEEGYYKGEVICGNCDIFYSKYSAIREEVSRRVLGCEVKNVWNNIENFLDKPFVEFLQTSDCGGAIDCTVAKKILHDFETYQLSIKDGLNEYLSRFVDNYISTLRAAVENKGVVYYS